MFAAGLCATAALAVGVWIWVNRRPSVEELRAACSRASQLRQWDKLQQHATQWVAVDPSSAEARLFQTAAYTAREDYVSAAESLSQIPESSPEAQNARVSLMELQFGPLNQPRSGAVTAQQILKHDPKSLVARQRLIFFYTMTLQRARLNKQIRAALELDTQPREAFAYLFLLDSLFFSNGIEQNGNWLAGEPGHELFTVAQAIFIAESLDSSLSMDDREAAQAALRAQSRKVGVLEKLQEKYPHNVELLAYQLRDCLLTGKVERAVELLAQAPKQALEDNRFWRFKGWIHAQSGEAKEAEAAYQRAIKLHPLDWWTRHLLADLLLRQDRLPEVERLRALVNRASELRRAILHAPSARQISPEILTKLADYAAECGDSQTAKVLRKRLQENKQGPQKQAAS